MKKTDNQTEKIWERYKALSESINQGLYTSDKFGRYTYVSPAVEQLTGYRSFEMLGRSYTMLNHPDDLHAVTNLVDKIYSGEVVNSIHRIIIKSGEVRWVYTSIKAVLENGEVKAIDGLFTDITEQKLAEEALKESEEKFKTIFDNANDLIIYTDIKGNIIDASNRAEELLGYTREEVIGRNFLEFDLFNPEQLKKSLKHLDDTLSDKPGYMMEYEIFHKNGSPFFIEVNSRLIREEGAPKGIINIIRDITDRKMAEVEKKKLEAQLMHSQKMEAIGTMAGGIAHDFNNILGAIILNTEMAIDDFPTDNALKDTLKQVLKSSIRAKDLVQQILTFSQNSKVEQKPIKIDIIVNETIKMMRAMIPAIVDIQTDIPADIGFIMADPSQIQQLVMNLCANATYAMKENGGILEIKIVSVLFQDIPTDLNLPQGVYVKLSVSDTGEGISDKIKNRIFDPFFTTKQPGEGTGLGLSVVHGILIANDGAISVDSKPGHDTTFHVFFPKVDLAPPASYKGSKTIPVGNERVLIVDDEKDFLDSNRRMLERLGYQVVPASSGKEALDIFTRTPNSFDLVITDMTMPRITGEKLSRLLLEIRPDIPIIICTGYSHLMNPDKAKALGIKKYIMKPYDKQEMAEVIRDVLHPKH